MKTLNFDLDKKHPPYVIAEVGINHGGSLETALKLIESAHKSGADAIKFQTYKSDLFISPESEYFSIFKSCELSYSMIKELVSKAKSLNINIFSAVFDFASADLWQELDASIFKIASGDITHYALLEYIAKFNKPIILSTGASNLEEISSAIDVIYKSNPTINLAILHCVSKYPTSSNETNLSNIKYLKEYFKVPVGFSDHTIGDMASMSAVSLGATIIEKHFTLNNNMEGPDHKLSMNPNDFKNFTKKLNEVYYTIGDYDNKVVEDVGVIKAIRRSLVAGRNIKKGEILNTDNIIFRRPQNGIPANEFFKINGKKAKQNITKDSLLEWSNIEIL